MKKVDVIRLIRLRMFKKREEKRVAHFPDLLVISHDVYHQLLLETDRLVFFSTGLIHTFAGKYCIVTTDSIGFVEWFYEAELEEQYNANFAKSYFRHKQAAIEGSLRNLPDYSAVIRSRRLYPHLQSGE